MNLLDFESAKNLKESFLESKSTKGKKVSLYNNLEAAMKELKMDKSRDPNGWLNELFKEGVSGNNLKICMLNLFNRIKIDFMRKADVTMIYKGKGGKCDINNDRGIFIVSIFRSLLMKLIYLDIYAMMITV